MGGSVGKRREEPRNNALALRKAVFKALQNKGGVKYLEDLATDNPDLFVKLLAKCLPTAVEVKNEGPLVVIRDYTGREIVRPVLEAEVVNDTLAIEAPREGFEAADRAAEAVPVSGEAVRGEGGGEAQSDGHPGRGGAGDSVGAGDLVWRPTGTS